MTSRGLKSWCTAGILNGRGLSLLLLLLGFLFRLLLDLFLKLCQLITNIRFLLNSDKVRPNKWYVVHLAKHAHNAAVVNARKQNRKEVIEEGGMFLEVESERLVVTAELIKVRVTSNERGT
jgi:hypothetical protein